MVQQLAEDVWWVDLLPANAYLVADDVLTLVDAGLPWQTDAILDAVREAGFEPADLTRVLVTHFDIDHVGGLAGLPASSIHVGEHDADFVTKRRRPPMSNRKTAFQRLSDPFRRAPTVPVSPVSDGDQIGSFTAIATPGHTRGHMAYVSTDLDVAFIGDLMMSDGAGLSPSPWYMSEDTEAVQASIEALEDAMPAVDVVCPGHGDPLVDGGYGAIAELAE